MTNAKGREAEPKLIKTFLDDINRVNIRRSFRTDWNELKEFFLTEQRKNKLKHMSSFRRWLYTVGWMLKGLFLRLTPFRRLMLVVAVVFFPDLPE